MVYSDNELSPGLKKEAKGGFSNGPVVETLPSNAGGVGSIPGQRTKIPHAALKGQRKKPRKKILSHATTRLQLEDITLSEISQSQKDEHCMIPLTHGTWTGKTHRKYSGGCQGLKE